MMMIPAIGPKTAVFFVLAVFVLVVFVLAVFVLAKAGPKSGQSRAKVRFLMFFPLGQSWAKVHQDKSSPKGGFGERQS